MLLDKRYHLSYCTNIHPGESWEEVFVNLESYFPPLKAKISPEAPLGIGLRLSDRASRELLEGDRMAMFMHWLQANGLYVFTMNGFPFGGFHRQVVKDDVHRPDWTTQERLTYTKRLAFILAALLPEGVEGGISTSPLSYKPWYATNEQARNEAYQTAVTHLLQVVEELLAIKQQTGKLIHIDIEPEPDGFLENSKEVLTLFNDWLVPLGIKRLTATCNLSPEEARKAIFDHLQLCYDVCHFALAYEQAATAFEKFKAAGIQIGKIQLSAALKAQLSENIEERIALAEKFRPFVESTYLHQVVERDSTGALVHYTDLHLALENIHRPEAREWRTHFHVPLFTHAYNGLYSTQDAIIEVLELLKKEPHTKHLEVETYTWEVLPEGLKKELGASIHREMEWVLNHIK